MRVCLLCRDVAPESHNGLARAMGDLAFGLAEIGHTVDLMVGSPGAAVDRGVVAIHPVSVPPPPGRFAGSAPHTAQDNLMYAAAVYQEVRRLHQQAPVDVVLSSLSRSEAAVCLLDDRFPTVITCITSLRTTARIDPRLRLYADLDRRLALEHQGLQRARYLHGLTRQVLCDTIADFDLQPAKTEVIGRGLRDRRRQGGEPARGERGVQVLFVGRLEPRKGVDTLLDAARRVVDAGVPMRFVFAGPEHDRSFRQAFEQAADGHPALRSAVRFLGAVSDAELCRLYAESDIVCAPSRYESHGIVLLEAMMFGKAIAACDGGGVREVVEDEKTGLLSAPEDATALAGSLRRLAENPGLRRELGERARSTYEKRFEIRAVATQLTAFLEDVVDIHSPAATPDEQVAREFAALIGKVLGLAPDKAVDVSRQLLGPSPPPWKAWTRRRVNAARGRVQLRGRVRAACSS